MIFFDVHPLIFDVIQNIFNFKSQKALFPFFLKTHS